MASASVGAPRGDSIRAGHDMTSVHLTFVGNHHLVVDGR
jgi:hypothetical protein